MTQDISPIIELQTALVQRIANDPSVLAVIPIDLMADDEDARGLYDYYPSKVPSEYIHIDGLRITNVHVAPEEVVDVAVTVHMWHNTAETGYSGNYRSALILQAVKKALRYRLIMPTYCVMHVAINDERIFDDVDADVKHAVFSLTYMLEKVKPTL